MFYAYAIWNKLRDKIYVGSTENIENRLKRHNNLLPNKGKSFTNKNSGVWKLIYHEKFQTRKEALKREKELKSFRGREFIRNKITAPIA